MPTFFVSLFFGIGYSMGNYGNYGYFWTGKVLPNLLGFISFILLLSGPVATVFSIRQNYLARQFGWLTINALVAAVWLLVLYCLIGGMLGFF